MAKIVDQAPMQQAPISPFDPNADMDVKRKRKLAEMLMKQGEQPNGTEVISGVAVKQSPLAGLARALTQGIGGYQAGEADRQDAQMQKDKMARMAAAIQSGKFDSLAQGSPDEQMLALKAKMDADAEARKFAQEMQLAQWKATHGGSGDSPAAIQISNKISDYLVAAKNATTPEEKQKYVFQANLLAQSAKMYEKNTTAFGASGDMSLSALPGYMDFVTEKSASDQQGKKDVDLTMNSLIAEKEKFAGKTAELNAQKLSDIETSNAGLDEFDQAANRLGTASEETPAYQTGQVGGRVARLMSQPERTNLDSALNETTLRAKTLLNMPSNNFSDADRDFLTEISGGKYALHGGYANVLKRMERMSTSQRNINNRRAERITGQQLGTSPLTAAPPDQPPEGSTATGPNGAKMIFKGGQWQPL